MRLEVGHDGERHAARAAGERLEVEARRRVSRPRARSTCARWRRCSSCRRSKTCAIRRSSRWSVSSRAERADLFALLEQRDVLLHHPYESFDPVVELHRAGRATIPTCWRSSRRCTARAATRRSCARWRRAAEQGKQVTVLVELTARFDEQSNIQWARNLEQAGAHVIYGVRGYKTHAKICLVVRRSRARHPPLRAPRHRQLQRSHRAPVHRLRACSPPTATSARTRRRSSTRSPATPTRRSMKKLAMAPDAACASASSS